MSSPESCPCPSIWENGRGSIVITRPLLLTPCGLIIGEKLEDGEPFETETDVLERFRDCGYPAATLKELELMFDADELIIFEFTNPYLDLEQKNACA